MHIDIDTKKLADLIDNEIRDMRCLHSCYRSTITLAETSGIQIQITLTREVDDHVPVIPDSPINITANPPRDLKDDPFERDLESWLKASTQKSTYEPDLRNFALRVAYWARGWAKKNLIPKVED